MEISRIDTILDILGAVENNQLHAIESERATAYIDLLLAMGMLEQESTQYAITDYGKECLKRAFELDELL
ncbi:MAG: hypothetical protein KAH86_01415 [Methanosarcinales archaeon]|nr:hypothetical protein [Methanosarcinales archaeon]